MQTWGIHNRFSIDARYVFILSFVFVVPLGNVAWPQNKFQVTKVASIHTIPSFSADETYADVIARLKELDVGIDPRAEPSCRPAQKFLRTEPESGSTLPNGGPVVVFYSKGPPLAGTVVRIPAFKGQPASNVTKALESMLLRVTEKSIASALRKGTFLRTEPIAATDVAACSEVVVVASNGIAPVESTIPNVPSKPVFEPDSAAAATSASKKTQLLRVPDLANMPLKSVELTLRKSGFKSTKPQFEHAANIARDHVIRTEPSAGSERPRGSEVTVYYSLGQTLLRIPFLQGIKIKSALQSLKEMEISPIQPMGEFSDKSPLQEVTRTRPPGGSEYLRGTSVTVYYSLGPEPFWKCLLRWFGELPMWAKAAEAFAAIAAARHGWRRIKGGSSSPAPAMPSVSGSLVHGVCEIHTPNGPTLQISISGGLGTSEVPNLRFTHHGSTS